MVAETWVSLYWPQLASIVDSRGNSRDHTCYGLRSRWGGSATVAAYHDFLVGLHTRRLTVQASCELNRVMTFERIPHGDVTTRVDHYFRARDVHFHMQTAISNKSLG